MAYTMDAPEGDPWVDYEKATYGGAGLTVSGAVLGSGDGENPPAGP